MSNVIDLNSLFVPRSCPHCDSTQCMGMVATRSGCHLLLWAACSCCGRKIAPDVRRNEEHDWKPVTYNGREYMTCKICGATAPSGTEVSVPCGLCDACGFSIAMHDADKCQDAEWRKGCEFGIVANFTNDGHKRFPPGRRVWVESMGSGGYDRIRVYGGSRGGRNISYWVDKFRLERFRPRWIPDALREPYARVERFNRNRAEGIASVMNDLSDEARGKRGAKLAAERAAEEAR